MGKLVHDLLAAVRSMTGAPPAFEPPDPDEDEGRLAPLSLNDRGDLLIAQALPRAAEIARMRQSYSVIATSAPSPTDSAMPTTNALLTISNGEPDTGMSYVVETVYLIVTATAPAATPVSIVGMLNVGRQPLVAAGLTPSGICGQVYRGSAKVAAAVTVVDDGWFPIGNSVIASTDTEGLGVFVDVNGLFIIPPGGKFSLNFLANTVTGLAGMLGMRWSEVQLPLR